MTTGIERVDLASLTTTWAVSDSAFAANDIAGFQLTSFDVLDASTAYVAAYTSDFSTMNIWKVALDGTGTMSIAVTGVNAVEKTLEIIGNTLFFGDTTAGAEGARLYDLTVEPPAEVGAPLGTGLAPYSMVAIP